MKAVTSCGLSGFLGARRARVRGRGGPAQQRERRERAQQPKHQPPAAVGDTCCRRGRRSRRDGREEGEENRRPGRGDLGAHEPV
jgi:hypothetical protein